MLSISNLKGEHVYRPTRPYVTHLDDNVLIIMVDGHELENVSSLFWNNEKKVVHDGNQPIFYASAMERCVSPNGIAFLKLFSKEQSWYTLSTMDLDVEYNAFLVGFVVTDKNTGRSVNFQHDGSCFKYGMIGDDTFSAFNEDELDEITNWLSHQDEVDYLDMMIQEIVVDKGWQPINELLSNNGEVHIVDLQSLLS